jgi:hypothetical protein
MGELSYRPISSFENLTVRIRKITISSDQTALFPNVSESRPIIE